ILGVFYEHQGGFGLITKMRLFAAGSGFAALLLTAAAGQRGTPPSAQHEAVLNNYCVTCHNDRAKTGGLSLEKADLVAIPGEAEKWEKVIRKVRAGLMPPAGMPRPSGDSLDALADFLENSVDRGAAAKVNPGRATMHRLNRA